jgi:hypothetical protein
MVKMRIVVLWVVMLYSIVDITIILEEHIFIFRLELHFSHEDGSDTVLWNIDNRLHSVTTQKTTIQPLMSFQN